MHNVQLLAARAVGQVLVGHNLNQVLDELRRKHPGLNPQQRSALQDLSYTTLRWLGSLDATLQRFLQRPLTDERVRCLLLVALGQLEYGKSAPHAVVDNAVRAAASFKQVWARGLVNAVLRNFLRQRETLIPETEFSESARLSYPEWWIAKLKQQYPNDWQAMLMAGNGHPPMTLRVNTRKTAQASYFAQLAENEIYASTIGAAGIRLERPMPVDKLPEFSQGHVSVQDFGAQQAALLLDVSANMRVLDACSAPGGKSAHLLEIADIDLLSLDSDAERLEKVRENFTRLGLAGQIMQGDAAKPETWWGGKSFDRILADVPCSASGIVRRHPDIKWLRREADIAGFAAQQLLILRGLWSTLSKGGKLLYATCSVFQEENRLQVETFLAETPDARRLPLALEQFSGLEKEGQLLPCDAHDGFYYALLQKI